MLSDLRESGSIEQDADTVLFAYREAYYLAREMDRSTSLEREADIRAKLANCRNRLDLIISKQRNGPVGEVTLWCDLSSNVIRDVAPTVSRRAA